MSARAAPASASTSTRSTSRSGSSRCSKGPDSGQRQPDRPRAALADVSPERRRPDPRSSSRRGSRPSATCGSTSRSTSTAARRRCAALRPTTTARTAAQTAVAWRRRSSATSSPSSRVWLRHGRSWREGRPAGGQAVRALLQPARPDAQRPGGGAVPVQPDRGPVAAPGGRRARRWRGATSAGSSRTSPAADGPHPQPPLP